MELDASTPYSKALAIVRTKIGLSSFSIKVLLTKPVCDSEQDVSDTLDRDEKGKSCRASPRFSNIMLRPFVIGVNAVW
jgi:hypothetical protein